MGDEVTVVAGFDTGGVSVLRTTRRPDGKGKFVRGRGVGGVGEKIGTYWYDISLNFLVDCGTVLGRKMVMDKRFGRYAVCVFFLLAMVKREVEERVVYDRKH